MENVGFYSALTRASSVSLNDSSVLFFFFFPFFLFLVNVVVTRYRGTTVGYRQILLGDVGMFAVNL